MNYSQFLIFLFRQFDFWINSTSISKDYKSLRDFIVGDQFLSTLPVDLRLFVKERKPASAEEMAELADTYASTRKQFHNAGSKNSEGKGVNKKSECKDSKVGSSEQKESSKQSNRLCYKCGESGHLIAWCPLRNNAGKQNAKVDLVVYYSGREGPISSGKVNGVNVGKILRDTRCTSVLVNDKCVSLPDEKDLRFAKTTDYLGRSNIFPIVQCYIESPWYVGWCEAIRAPIHDCDVLLGNIEGVCDIIDSHVKDDKILTPDVNVKAITRSQAQMMSKPKTPLVTKI